MLYLSASSEGKGAQQEEATLSHDDLQCPSSELTVHHPLFSLQGSGAAAKWETPRAKVIYSWENKTSESKVCSQCYNSTVLRHKMSALQQWHTYSSVLAKSWQSASRRLSSRNFKKSLSKVAGLCRQQGARVSDLVLALVPGKAEQPEPELYASCMLGWSRKAPQKYGVNQGTKSSDLGEYIAKMLPISSVTSTLGQNTLPQIHQFPSHYECLGCSCLKAKQWEIPSLK